MWSVISMFTEMGRSLFSTDDSVARSSPQNPPKNCRAGAPYGSATNFCFAEISADAARASSRGGMQHIYISRRSIVPEEKNTNDYAFSPEYDTADL